MTEVIKKPADAEVHAAAWMRALGFYDAQETPVTADAGLDVVASNGVAQVKFKAVQVGRPELQNFMGAAHPYPDRLRLFFSWKGYSTHALQYAEQAQIALFSYELDGRCMPENAFAQHLCTPIQQTESALPWAGVVPVQPAASWWTPRRIKWLTLAVLALAAVIFFMIRPDIFAQLVATAVAIFLIMAGLGFGRPKKRRRHIRRR